MEIKKDTVFFLSSFCSLLCDVFMVLSGTHSDGFIYFFAGAMVTLVTSAYYFREWYYTDVSPRTAPAAEVVEHVLP